MRGLWSKMRVTEAPAPASAGGGSRSNTLLTTSNMAVLNIGSLNLDYVYRVDHFVRPGETLAASHRAVHAGGKGLNQSVALARAGATVLHAGCVGADGGMLLEVLKGEGVDVSMLAVHESEASGHTFIQVTEDGENGILYYPGTNGRVTVESMLLALDACEKDDIVMCGRQAIDGDCARTWSAHRPQSVSLRRFASQGAARKALRAHRQRDRGEGLSGRRGRRR